MTLPIVIKEPEIRDSEIKSWLRKHKLKRTAINITKATNALRAEKQEDAIPAGRDVSVIGADASRRVIYGECKVGGTIVFVESTGNNQYIHLVVAIATHQINAVTKLYLDEAEVVFVTGTDGWSNYLLMPDGSTVAALNKVWMQVESGTDAQAANAALITNNPTKWTADHKLSGVAYAYILLVWDGFLFGDGLPEISFRVQGKLVYDPRTATNRYTATTAVVIADYLTNTRFGLGVSYADRIDEANLIIAADICDELVTLQGGGQEYRYAVHGYFDIGESHGRVLERLAANMGGSITYSNGLWKFWPAAYRAPSITLTQDDIRSSIKMQTLASREDIFNSVRGVFTNGAKDFIVTDYPAVTNLTYIAQDGEQIFENIDFHFVTSGATCQRLAKIELERMRQGIQLEFLASPKAFQLETPKTVAITLDRYGWAAKEFEVIKVDFQLNENGSAPEVLIALTLRETGPGVFNFNYWEETTVDIAPNTNLPSPFATAELTSLMLESGTDILYRRGDGTIAPRIKVSWAAFTDFFLTSGGHVEVQFKQSASETWIDSANVPASSNLTYITDVQDGVHYDVRARSVNTFGVPSSYVTVYSHFVIGKTAPPANVTGFAAAISEYGITLGWTKVADFDLKEYEIREGASWDTAAFITRVQSTTHNINIRAAGSYTFLIKAVDTTGNYSSNATSTVVTIIAPSIAAASFVIEDTDVIFDWDEATLGSWAINIYDVYYGDAFETATFLLSTKASTARVFVTWSGTRKFWFVARDIYGNTSTPISVIVPVSAPNAITSFIASVIDNNVLAKWVEPTGSTLPIKKYVFKKGAVYGSAETIGEIFGTFTVLFELLAGSYTYWVEAVDSAGNHGPARGTTVNVNEPPDFQLIAEVTLTNGSSLMHCREEPVGTIIGPINILRTWEDHFLVQSWTTPQDQITAGYPVFIQPTRDYGRWEKVHDLGTTVNNVLIHLIYTRTDIVGTGDFIPKIAYSTDGISYTEESNVVAVLASAVRYIRIRLDFGTVP